MTDTTISTFGVIGAGQMGGGIAQVAAQTGYAVLLLDASKELAEKGKNRIGGTLGKLVEKGKLPADQRDAILGRITPIADASEFAAAQIVVEAATENLELKLKLLQNADKALADGAILASNTSSISITKLASVTSRPATFIGMHFMNPVPLMKLVEIVRGVATSAETYATVKALAEKLGKTVITSNDAPGFLVNRILLPLLNEAVFAYQEGVGSIEDIDQGAKLGLNHPMGPFELADLIGLDTVLAIGEVLHRELGDSKYRPPTLLRNLVAAGWHGKKVGKGFYSYEGGQRGAATIAR